MLSDLNILPDVAAVYAIACVETGDIYVGCTIDSLRRRIHQHYLGLRTGKHPTPAMQELYDRHGDEGFEVMVLWSRKMRGRYAELRLAATERKWLRLIPSSLNRDAYSRALRKNPNHVYLGWSKHEPFQTVALAAH